MFRYGVVQPDGASIGDHAASGKEQMEKFGLKPKQPIVTPDDGPPFPAPLLYLWNWFIEHMAGLPVNGVAVPVVTWESLAAWSRLMHIRLEPWEAIEMIELGALRASVQMKKKA